MTKTENAAKISWLVYDGDVMIPRTSFMRGTWAYEATCSCGWQTKVGGGVEREIRNQIRLHKMHDHNN
jgi:hypothetical protein